MRVRAGTREFKFSNVNVAGYSALRNETFSGGGIEVNEVIFQVHDQQVRIVCGDFLYFGDIANRLESAGQVTVCAASHTHFSAATDSSKPGLGTVNSAVVSQIVSGIQNLQHEIHDVDFVEEYRFEVRNSVYRRLDVAIPMLGIAFSAPGPSKRRIDRSVCILVFGASSTPKFAIAYHANHPVVGATGRTVSSDYVGALRRAIRERFAVKTVLFFQGCAGDVRPNITAKRFPWLPKCRLNTRFVAGTEAQRLAVIAEYEVGVRQANLLGRYPLEPKHIGVKKRSVTIDGLGQLEINILEYENLEVVFLPFEVSHLYHSIGPADLPKQFIVSCVNNVLGYLPHESQLRFGGYEVDRSRDFVGLQNRIFLRDSEWRMPSGTQ